MAGARFHVLARADQWRVEREGGLFAIAFATKDEAVRAAESRARIAQPAVVVLHDAAGLVQDELSYGDERSPARS